MTCVELQESLAENERASSAAQRAHLKDCPHCAALVADLLVIACTAGELRAAEEPSPRVWNSIEIALRREGLIKPQRSSHSLLPAFNGFWGWRWVLPVAAAMLITFGIYMRQHSPAIQVATTSSPSQQAVPGAEFDVASASLDDNDLMQEIAQQSPALQAVYTDNLRRVNQYIQDARNSIVADPNDLEARRSLMDAYQQKAMLFDLAMDRSLP